MRMVEGIAVVVAALVLVALAVGTIFIVGMRTKSPLVLDRIRSLNRRVFNPVQMKSAGTPGAYASVIRHRGRKTGTVYETPIGAVEAEDGFVIALPYGLQANWVRNVLASGAATLVHEGHTNEVARPEIVPIASAQAHFSDGDRRAQRIFGVTEGLRLRLADSEGASESRHAPG